MPRRHFTRLNILFYRFRVQVPERYEALYSHIADGRRRVFSAMVTAMDDAVGRIVQALRRYRHYNDTLIVFTSDVRQPQIVFAVICYSFFVPLQNGGSPQQGGNNWPLRGGKSSVWEGGTRVPTFVWGKMLTKTGYTHDGSVSSHTYMYMHV